jgi:hypothetical protein
MIPGWNNIVLIDGIDDRKMSNFVLRLPARLPALLSSVFVRVCRWRWCQTLPEFGHQFRFAIGWFDGERFCKVAADKVGFLRSSPPSALYLGRRFGKKIQRHKLLSKTPILLLNSLDDAVFKLPMWNENLGRLVMSSEYFWWSSSCALIWDSRNTGFLIRQRSPDSEVVDDDKKLLFGRFNVDDDHVRNCHDFFFFYAWNVPERDPNKGPSSLKRDDFFLMTHQAQ